MAAHDCSYCSAMAVPAGSEAPRTDRPRVESEGCPERTDDSIFQVVVVCTGNRARSPLAAALLARRLEHLPARVTSVGTLDLGPVPALPDAVETAAALGIDLGSHRACTYRGAGLGDVDLVLGFERPHLATAVVDWGAARERTFTIPELVQLLEYGSLPGTSDPVRQARMAIEQASARRTDVHLAEVADPLGRPAAYYRDLGSRLADLCDRLVVGLFGDHVSLRSQPGEIAAQARAESARRDAS